MVSPALNQGFVGIIMLFLGGIGFVRLMARAVTVIRIERNWLKELQNPINSLAHVLLPGACFLTVIYLIVRAIVDAWDLLIRLAIFKRHRSSFFTAEESSAVQEHTPM
jgi:hypothetical protein